MPGKDKTEGKMGKELDKGGGVATDITERKRAEDGQRKALAEALQATHALRESEERFRSLFEGVPVGLYRTTPGGQIVDANPALVHMLGYPNREALLAINAADLCVDAEERRRWQALMERKGVVRNFEVQLRQRDGTIIWVEDNARAIRDADGRVLYYDGSLDDITERKQMEEQAGEIEELYRSMVELSPDSILTVDTKGVITSCNTTATRMLGYSRDEMVGKHFSELGAIRLRDLPKYLKLFRSVLGGKVTEPLELTFLRKDGTPLLSDVRINLLKVGGKTILQSTARDITERKRAEEKLRSSEERLKILFEFAPDAIYLNDLKGTFIDGNKAAEELTGYKREELIGKSFLKLKLLPPSQIPKAAALLARNVLGQPTGPDEFTLKRKDGSQVPVEMMTFPVKVKDQILVLGIARDISERKRAEEALRESEEKYRHLVERANDGILIIQDRIIKYANPRSTEMGGYTVEEMIGTPFTDHVHPDEVAKTVDRYKRRMSGEDVEPIYETVLKRRDGSDLNAELNAGIITHQGKPADLVFVRDITERKRVEEALQDAELRYRTVADFTYDWEYWANPDGTMRYVSPACERITGYAAERFMADPHFLTELILPEDSKIWAEHRHDAYERPGLREVQFRIRRRDGETRWIEHACQPVMDEQGTFLGLRASNRDITERMRAEEALAKRTHDLGERVKELNCLYGISELVEKPDISLEELIRGVVDLIPPAWQYPEVTCARIILEGEEFRTEDFRETTWKQSSDIVVHGQRVGTLEVCYLEERPESDEGPFLKEERNLLNAIAERLERITEREQAEEALKESEERYRDLFENANDLIQSVAPDGRFVYVNRAWREALGYDEEEIAGLSMFDTIHPDNLAHCVDVFQRVMSGEKVDPVEAVFVTKDGKKVTVEGSAVCKLVDGKPVYTQGIFRDVTERRRAEEALKEYSERLGDMVEERTRELREAQAQLLAQQRLQQEVELAAQVQTSLLPRGVPSLEGFDFAATALPARYVSGDMYDFTRCGPETCHIVLADIAGKGIPAALLTSTARALMRAETEHEDSPATILSSVNTALYEDLAHAEVFITFLAARLDVRLGTLTYANAGHTETLWWQQANRTCRTLPATGLPLGIDADAPILEETLTLRPGDVLVFYSDGITEAANPHDELFGLDRLIAILSEHAHLPASELTQAIVEAVETFRAGAPLSDDLTLIVLKVLPRTISFTYPATLDHLNEVTALVRQVASAYGSDFAYQMELTASEIVTNVIQHAYRTSSGEIRGQITLSPNQVQLDLYDDGAPFDPSQVPPPDLTEELQDRGRGLFVARQLADELIYNPATPEGNHWRLIKRAEGA